MEFRILKIILWPRDRAHQLREITFSAYSVNVITGASRTGKSAIVPIIDYCLGADKCSIPVGIIRQNCEWFGILIQTATGQYLIARREPGDQKATSDAFTAEGVQVQIPSLISAKNCTIDAVKVKLDEMSGLTNLRFDMNETSGFGGRPSFRDLAAFTFQPQNIVANPNVLFFKADSYEHREKLRHLLPYALGIVTPELMGKQHQLTELRKRLKRKERELEDARDVSARWVAELQLTVSQARELGLLESSVDTSSIERTVRALRGLLKKTPIGTTNAGAIARVGGDLETLRAEEEELSLKLANLRQRYIEMSNLRSASAAYRRSVHVQQQRLEVSGFLAKLVKAESKCPICGSDELSHEEELSELVASLRAVEASAADFQILPATFDREFEKVRSQIDALTETLGGTRIQIRGLQDLDQDARKRRYTEQNLFRYLGSLESDLKIFGKVSENSSLVAEISELKSRISELAAEVSEASLEDRKRRILNALSQITDRYIHMLDVENPDDRVLLSITDLTLKVEGPDRDDYLWEIGSGSNWVSYHVALSLALQLFFLKQEENPTPNFIVYDQPSQVYFPKKLSDNLREEDLDPQLSDSDVIAVRKIFKAFAAAGQDSRQQLQVIVLDHAPESVWAGIPEVALVEEWRGEVNKLIPPSWYERT